MTNQEVIERYCNNIPLINRYYKIKQIVEQLKESGDIKQ